MELTTERLLASDEREYMNEAQLAYFRELLNRQKSAILAQRAAPQSELLDPTGFADPVDRASYEEERATLHRERERLDVRLMQINQALSRIETGDYGFCSDTGDPIGLGRLVIQPTATLCIEAQERSEHLRRR